MKTQSDKHHYITCNNCPGEGDCLFVDELMVTNDEDVEIAKSIIHQLRVREDSIREYRERLENKIKEYHTPTQ